MKRVLELIEECKRSYARHAFSVCLEGTGDVEDARAFVPGMTFFVLTLQDLLRINAANVQAPFLAEVATRHHLEDSGHEAWFLHDMRLLGEERDLAWVFGPDQRIARDLSYALIGEIYRATDDRVRVALAIAIEATGEVIVSRAYHFIADGAANATMQYFSIRHNEMKLDRDMLGADRSRGLANTQLPSSVYEECAAMVERVFAALTQMTEDLHGRILKSRRQRQE